MARKPQVSVEPRPDGRWAVQTDGTQRADSRVVPSEGRSSITERPH
jgi:hypothetical protein